MASRHMQDKKILRLTTLLQRKDPRLPVYVVIPGNMVVAWQLAGTTIIEGTANGHDCGRRTVKAWGKGSDDWFIEFTKPFCKTAGLTVGAPVTLELRVADNSTPQELASLLSVARSLQAAWSGLAERERREASEYIRAARTAATRARRAASIIERLRLR